MASRAVEPAPRAAAAAAPASSNDTYYRVTPALLERTVADKSWLKDPKHFSKVKISAGAAMKMVAHAMAGVDKGRHSSNGMPIEVMGLLHGHADDVEPRTLIVTDAFPLPVEGTETSVMTDNEEVTNYMIALSDALETTRTERFMGWYHSHPFDVSTHSNAFLSATDVSTQLSWQISEDAAGNPWLALVVDPLRCIAKGRPEIGAFRCYPPAFTPERGMAPDGVIWEDERARNARWGESCVSYYELTVDYFTSTLGSALLGILARDYMWTRVLSSTPFMEKEARDHLPGRIKAVKAKLVSAERGAGTGATMRTLLSYDNSRARGGMASSSDVSDAVTLSSELAGESVRCHCAHVMKSVVFNRLANISNARLDQGSRSAADALAVPVGVTIPPKAVALT